MKMSTFGSESGLTQGLTPGPNPAFKRAARFAAFRADLERRVALFAGGASSFMGSGAGASPGPDFGDLRLGIIL